jgi:dTMP kinase
MFIALEGMEGVGKSTHLQYMGAFLNAQQIPVLLTREPGGTDLGNALRNLLLAHHQELITPMTELLLMFAARAQHIESLIKPALAQKKWVLCDRFIDSTYAYQGSGRGIAMTDIAALESLVLADFKADHTLIFDAPVELALSRLEKRGPKDRIENEQIDFFNRVRHYYQSRASVDPEHYTCIDASGSLESVQQTVLKVLQQLLMKAGHAKHTLA